MSRRKLRERGITYRYDPPVKPFGSAIRCPKCGKILTKSKHGLESHMRKHVRDGDMTREETLVMLHQIFPNNKYLKLKVESQIEKTR